jgi:hypothetical protein
LEITESFLDTFLGHSRKIIESLTDVPTLGFNLSREPTARDLFKSITTEIAPPNILEKVKHLPLTFSPWSPELYEECMVKQRANFGKNAVRSFIIYLLIPNP